MATIMAQRAGSKPPELVALTKPEAHRLLQAEAGLSPYQDERLEIYRRQHVEMGGVFDRARQCRKGLQEEYDRRSREIAGKLESITKRTDAAALRQQDRIKNMSTEFDEGTLRRTHEWHSCLSAQHAEVRGCCDAITEDLVGLGLAISEEVTACKAAMSSASQPLIEKLKENRRFLEEETACRERAHAEFVKSVGAEFARLRKRLGKESEARKKQSSETQAEVKKHYSELAVALDRQGTSVSEWLRNLSSLLEEEKAKRAKSQETIVQNLMTFMVDFERHIAAGKESQEGVHVHLLSMKRRLRSNDPP